MRDIKLLVLLGVTVCVAGHVTALVSETESTITIDPTIEDSSTSPEDTSTTLPQPVLCDSGVDFLPSSNCEEYFHCVHGVGILKICPDNLYWDPEINACNWDSRNCQSNEDNGEPNSPLLDCSSDNVKFLPYHPDCSKFIQCVFKHPIKQNCPSGLSWNQPLERCDYVCDYRLEIPVF